MNLRVLIPLLMVIIVSAALPLAYSHPSDLGEDGANFIPEEPPAPAALQEQESAPNDGTFDDGEPSTQEIFHSLNFTNITPSYAETFPAGLYEITLCAEFAGYRDTNELGYYPTTNLSSISTLFTGPEGGLGYVLPPYRKTFSCESAFGLSLYVEEENYTCYTEKSRNPDGQNHSQTYVNLESLENLETWLVAFEDLYNLGDSDYNDMVLSLQPKKCHLTVRTDPPAITTIPGEDWYPYFTDTTLEAPDIVSATSGTRYKFEYWDVDGMAEAPETHSIGVHMHSNHTATAHYKQQHYLTVNTDPPGIATIAGGGWLDANSQHRLYAPHVEDYIFNRWLVDGLSKGAGIISVNVEMDAPHTATAAYEPVPIGGSSSSVSLRLPRAWVLLTACLTAVAFVSAYYARTLRTKATRS